MCNPYLKDLKARLLQLEEFARSTILKCGEVSEAGIVPEQREPLAFTVRAVTRQVVAQYIEVQDAYRETTSWNSVTDKSLIAQFARELTECHELLLDVVHETRLLHERVREIGLPDEYVGRFDDFDQMFHTFQYRQQFECDSEAIARENISSYLNESATRSEMLNRITQFEKSRSGPCVH